MVVPPNGGGICVHGITHQPEILLAFGAASGLSLVAQEHSGIRDLWALPGRPQVLIYLDAQPATMNRRQGRSDWTAEARADLVTRLEHARRECDLYLPTDDLTIPQVLEIVVKFLEQHFQTHDW